MHVVSNKTLKAFAAGYPDAGKPLQAWHKAMEKGCFASCAGLKQVFGSVDKAGDLCVFDIGGNKYRLIAYARFDWQRCYVKHMLTLAEYDQERWKSSRLC